MKLLPPPRPSSTGGIGNVSRHLRNFGVVPTAAERGRRKTTRGRPPARRRRSLLAEGAAVSSTWLSPRFCREPGGRTARQAARARPAVYSLVAYISICGHCPLALGRWPRRLSSTRDHRAHNRGSAHNQEVAGSNPAPATAKGAGNGAFRISVVPGQGTSLPAQLRDTTPVQPETRYAKSGNVNIAYQVVGDGPPDLVAVDVISHIELAWEIPSQARFFTRLASICRLFRVNQRGTGMSDRDAGVPTLETRMDDIRAVLDAAGSERAVLFGLGDASPLSVLFAATYPERTAGLILMNASPRFVRSPSLPWLPTREETQRQADDFERRWGDPAFAYEFIGMSNPSATEEELQDIARVFRLSVSPGAAAAYIRMNIDVDVCDVLPLIRVPTLVMHRKDGGAWDIRSGRYLAEHIPGARFVELPGADFSPTLGEQEPLFAELESFLADVVAGNASRGRARQGAGHCPVLRHRRLQREGGSARRQGLARAPAASPRACPPPAGSLSRPGGGHGRRRLLRLLRRPG